MGKWDSLDEEATERRSDAGEGRREARMLKPEWGGEFETRNSNAEMAGGSDLKMGRLWRGV